MVTNGEKIGQAREIGGEVAHKVIGMRHENKVQNSSQCKLSLFHVASPQAVLKPGVIASASVLQREPIIGLARVFLCTVMNGPLQGRAVKGGNADEVELRCQCLELSLHRRAVGGKKDTARLVSFCHSLDTAQVVDQTAATVTAQRRETRISPPHVHGNYGMLKADLALDLIHS